MFNFHMYLLSYLRYPHVSANLELEFEIKLSALILNANLVRE